MRRIEGYRDLAPEDRGASAAIGNFDGVHRGHQVLIGDADKARRATGAPLGVITFEPHPRRHFQPDAPPFRLTTAGREGAGAGVRSGSSGSTSCASTRALAGMQAEDFVRDVLVAGFGISHIVVGADFRFGKGRKGDAVLLRRMSAELGFGLTIHEMIGDETGEFASTALARADRGGALPRGGAPARPLAHGLRPGARRRPAGQGARLPDGESRLRRAAGARATASMPPE